MITLPQLDHDQVNINFCITNKKNEFSRQLNLNKYLNKGYICYFSNNLACIWLPAQTIYTTKPIKCKIKTSIFFDRWNFIRIFLFRLWIIQFNNCINYHLYIYKVFLSKICSYVSIMLFFSNNNLKNLI